MSLRLSSRRAQSLYCAILKPMLNQLDLGQTAQCAVRLLRPSGCRGSGDGQFHAISFFPIYAFAFSPLSSRMGAEGERPHRHPAHGVLTLVFSVIRREVSRCDDASLSASSEAQPL